MDDIPETKEPEEKYEDFTKQPNVNSVENVAREVIAGHWGVGNIRKQRLTDAGWDADAVQREVTRIFNQG